MKLGPLLLGFVKPFIDSELTSLSNTIKENIPALEAEYGAGSQTAVAFVLSKVQALVSKSPFLALVAAMLFPTLEAFLTGLTANGQTQVGPLLLSVANFLVKEEQYI